MQRNSSWPGDNALHKQAEYICADLSIALRFSLAVARRTIHWGNYVGRIISELATIRKSAVASGDYDGSGTRPNSRNGRHFPTRQPMSHTCGFSGIVSIRKDLYSCSPNLCRYALGETPVCRWKRLRKNATS